MTTIMEMPVDEAMKLINTSDFYVKISGYNVKTRSDRYKLFRKKGFICCRCGRVGTVMRVERNDTDPGYPNNRAHFNLYTDDGVLMTKDHIVPKSKGGKNTLSNYQPMCTLCNVAKGNRDEVVAEKDVVGVNYYTYDQVRVKMVRWGFRVFPERCPNMWYEWDGLHFVRYDNGALAGRFSGIPRRHQSQRWCVLS